MHHKRMDLRQYWTFLDDMAVIDGVILNGRHIVVHNTLQKQALEQLYVNHMEMDKTKLLACISIYLPGINSNIKKNLKN